MHPGKLKPGNWYFVRKHDGTLIPYRLHRVIENEASEVGGSSKVEVEMFVGSMTQTFLAGQIVAPAEMPTDIQSKINTRNA